MLFYPSTGREIVGYPVIIGGMFVSSSEDGGA
jgi:hypothetical protein